ncbi:hypothetical protein TNCV_2825451, partial [Trichonephila clavipes]
MRDIRGGFATTPGMQVRQGNDAGERPACLTAQRTEKKGNRGER